MPPRCATLGVQQSYPNPARERGNQIEIEIYGTSMTRDGRADLMEHLADDFQSDLAC
jgi:hypothetical protein